MFLSRLLSVDWFCTALPPTESAVNAEFDDTSRCTYLIKNTLQIRNYQWEELSANGWYCSVKRFIFTSVHANSFHVWTGNGRRINQTNKNICKTFIRWRKWSKLWWTFLRSQRTCHCIKCKSIIVFNAFAKIKTPFHQFLMEKPQFLR